MPNLVVTAARIKALTMFVVALQACELSDTLSSHGPFTIFAPLDLAFAELPAIAPHDLHDDSAELSKLLAHHIVPGVAMAADLVALGSATTLQGTTLVFANSDGLHVNHAQIVDADIEADNGVIHIIDAPLWPIHPSR